ncbi:elongator complex protein 5 [Bombina bombina]|uniref:elongator complex protein 5 n=1 Tax=Bombina bombina TaxID=8345 RepID=UPI00235B0AC8|nr:elongator complex protein 5 [Bombina bombina]
MQMRYTNRRHECDVVFQRLGHEAVNMLQELRNQFSSGVLLITDTALHSGRELLNSFLVASLQRKEFVHVFGYEISQKEFSSGFPPEILTRLAFHDGFSDPLNWNNAQVSLTPLDFSVDRIWKHIGDDSHPVTIVLDSLSWLLAHCPLPSVCHTLRNLPRGRKGAGSRAARVIALLHSDLHTPGVLHSVRLLADTVINVTENGEHNKVTVTHQKKSGKVVTTGEDVRIQDGFTLEIIKAQETEQKRREQVESKMNLTFNPHLSDFERELKESATLPYTFSDSK